LELPAKSGFQKKFGANEYSIHYDRSRQTIPGGKSRFSRFPVRKTIPYIFRIAVFWCWSF
jgi:hypothetical protein